MGVAQYCCGCGLAFWMKLCIAAGGGQYNCGGSWCCGRSSQMWVWLSTVLSVFQHYCGWRLMLLWLQFNTIVAVMQL